MGIHNHPKQWSFLERKWKSGKMSHAYLLSGEDPASITLFAKEFVTLVNCLSAEASAKADDQCQNCKMIKKGIFPDLKIVSSDKSDSSVKNEKDMMAIEIDQIREVQYFLALKSYYGGYKTVIIENSERMTQDAQNCFLKNLEEPKGKTLIFLIASKPELLLSTIFSRCQEIKFSGEKNNITLPQRIGEDLLSILNADLAEKFKYTKTVNLEGEHFGNLMKNLQWYFRNKLFVKLGIIEGEMETHSVEKLKKSIRLIDTINHQVATSNANPKLALEVLLLEI